MRCATDTKPPFDAVMAQLRATGRLQRDAIKRGRAADGKTVLMQMQEFGATPTGQKEIAAAIEEFEADRDMATVAWLKGARIRGAAMHDAAKEATKLIKNAKIKAEKAETGWVGQPTVSAKANDENNTAAIYPGLIPMWRPEDNNGVEIHQTTPGQHIKVTLTCVKCEAKFKTELKNLGRKDRPTRKMPSCGNCRSGRQKSFEGVQATLRDFQKSVGGDPDAWKQISPAMRLAIMEKSGMLSKQRTEFERATAMAMVHGDLTLEEVLAAKKMEDIQNRVHEDDIDGDDTDAEVALIEGITSGESAEFDTADQTTRVGRIMSSAGAARLVADDEELVAQIVHENVESAWNAVHDNPDDVEVILGQMRAAAKEDPYRQRVVAEFEQGIRAAQARPLPEGYESKRTLADGEIVDMQPLISQQRFAMLAEERKRIFNFSGTGAGKTLSSILATRASGAEETVVVCPAAVEAQWREEYAQAFPDTDVRKGLPTARDRFDDERTGRRRVWVVSHDAFSKSPEKAEAALDALSTRAGAVVIDEIHQAKSSEAAAASLRSEAMRNFIDKAGKSNPDLMVIGQTATPVVNDLSEGKSILRLVQGEDPKFGTKPTIKNATDCYRAMSAAGVRWRPDYKPALHKPEVTVDISNRLPQVMGRVKALQKAQTKPGPITPAMMERALLPEKLDAITAAVKQNERPTIVYSEFTTGMVDPIVDRMRAEGFTAERYTGEEHPDVRHDLVQRFQRGEIRVLVGSGPIATGVDGLQRSSHNAVVASVPWTAAKDDQLVGRLYRTGQTRDTTVTYIKTEAKVGDLSWSWDESRFARVRFKRGLADAAVDGIVPDGKLATQSDAAVKMFASLHTLTDSLLGDRDD